MESLLVEHPKARWKEGYIQHIREGRPIGLKEARDLVKNLHGHIFEGTQEEYLESIRRYDEELYNWARPIAESLQQEAPHAPKAADAKPAKTPELPPEPIKRPTGLKYSDERDISNRPHTLTEEEAGQIISDLRRHVDAGTHGAYIRSLPHKNIMKWVGDVLDRIEQEGPGRLPIDLDLESARALKAEYETIKGEKGPKAADDFILSLHRTHSYAVQNWAEIAIHGLPNPHRMRKIRRV